MARERGVRFKRGTIICPCCNANGVIRGGEHETNLVKTLYVTCSNPDCSMGWRMQLSFLYVVSPSGIEGADADLAKAPADLKRATFPSGPPPPPGDPNQHDMFDAESAHEASG